LQSAANYRVNQAGNYRTTFLLIYPGVQQTLRKIYTEIQHINDQKMERNGAGL